MLQSRSSIRTRAQNLSNLPSPSSRLGRLFPPCGRNSVIPLCSLNGNLLLRPVELGFVDPHAVQNDRKLARDGDFGLAEAIALGEPRPPSFQCRLPQIGNCEASRHHSSRFDHSTPPRPKRGTCLSTDISAKTSRSREARRIVNRRLHLLVNPT